MTTLELYHSVLRRLTAAGILEPEAEATLLLSHLLGCRRSAIFFDGARTVAASVVEGVEQAINRRSAKEPLAYILGEQEFYGRAFTVTPDVLIPRPETELLVERAVHALRAQDGMPRPRILDLGVGSGVIAITMALEIPTAMVVGLDLSLAALQVARANASRHGAEQVRWLNSDWGTALGERCTFDLVAANPPYVAKELQPELQPELAAEPALALYGGLDGRRDLERIMGDVARLLVPGGILLMEIGFDQQEYVLAGMKALGQFDHAEVHLDYAGLPRILEARRNRCR
jgi:release factor glutamine methyltransferase